MAGSRPYARVLLFLVLLYTLTLPAPPAWGDAGTPPETESIEGAFVAEPADAWVEVWHAQGVLYAAAVAPGSENTHLWAVGDEGRLMRTVDGGRRWRFSRLLGRPTLRAVVLWDKYRGLVGGDDGAFFYTADGGETWTALTAPTAATIYVVDANENTVWLGGEEGLFISTDGMRTWTRVLSVPVRAWARGENRWVVGTNDGRIYLSTDNGATWQERTTGASAIHAIVIIPDAPDLYVAGPDGYVAHSPDGGLTWMPVSIPNSPDIYALAVAPDGEIWAAGEGGYIFNVSHPALVSILADEDQRTLYSLHIVGTGVFWAVGEGPDIVRSDDGGDTWTLQNGGRLARLYSVHFPSDTIGWAVGERERVESHRNEFNGIVLHTTDGGRSWEVQSLPTDENYSWLERIRCLDTQHCWAVGRYGRIFRTEDGGQTWERQYAGVSYWLHAVDFVSSTHGFIGGNRGVLFKTTDGGNTWVPIPHSGNNLPIYNLSALDEGRVAAALDQGYMMFTFNAGTYWRRIQAPYTIINNRPLVHLRGIAWTKPHRIWVTGYRGYLAAYNPETFTWSYREGGTKSYDWFGIAFTPDEWWGMRVGGLCAGYDHEGACVRYTGGLIAVTDNGAEQWTFYTTDTPGTLYDIALWDKDHAWAVGDAGVILRYQGTSVQTFAPRPDHAPTIDGDAWDWTTGRTLVLDVAHASTVGFPPPVDDADASARVYVWWDPETLYTLVHVRDNRVQEGDQLTLVWDGRGDGVGGEDDVSLTITPSGSYTPTQGVLVASRVISDGWQAEIRVPASRLGGNFSHDRTLRWTLALRDVDGEDVTPLVRYGRHLVPNAKMGRLTLLDKTIVLQNGRNRYSLSQDIWISNQWNEKHTNWTSDPALTRVLYVRGSDMRNALIWFDLSALPPGVHVESATLKLYADQRTGGGGLEVGAYPLRRPWRYDEVTGVEARYGEPWGSEGANDIERDRWATPVGTSIADGNDTWVTWEVTKAVHYWITHPDENFGLILKSFVPGYATVRFVGERNGVYEDRRPILEIRYSVPTPEATPTPSPTPTSTPTPTPTPSPTPTPTPTRTPTPTPTHTFLYVPYVQH